MWPLAVNKPKHLLPVAGKPLILHILDAIKENRIEEVLIVVGFRGDLIRSAIGDGSHFGLSVEYVTQPAWTGTASALKIAFDAVGREPFLAIYGDLWVSPSAVHTVIEKSRHFPRVVGIVHVPNASEYGLVELEGERLVRVLEKPSRKAKPEGWVNAGIYVLDPQVFEAIERTRASKRAEYELTTSLQHLLDDGKEIRGAVVASDDWIDLGRPWDLLKANERAMSKLSGGVKGTVEQGAELKGTVLIQENTVIKSGCYIEGPVYIGSNSSVGPNARIRPHSCIQDRVVVGAACEIKNSIIMSETKVPH